MLWGSQPRSDLQHQGVDAICNLSSTKTTYREGWNHPRLLIVKQSSQHFSQLFDRAINTTKKVVRLPSIATWPLPVANRNHINLVAPQSFFYHNSSRLLHVFSPLQPLLVLERYSIIQPSCRNATSQIAVFNQSQRWPQRSLRQSPAWPSRFSVSLCRGPPRAWALANGISIVGRASEDDGEDGRRSKDKLNEEGAD